jgi:hypothetical protein
MTEWHACLEANSQSKNAYTSLACMVTHDNESSLYRISSMLKKDLYWHTAACHLQAYTYNQCHLLTYHMLNEQRWTEHATDADQADRSPVAWPTSCRCHMHISFACLAHKHHALLACNIANQNTTNCTQLTNVNHVQPQQQHTEPTAPAVRCR